MPIHITIDGSGPGGESMMSALLYLIVCVESDRPVHTDPAAIPIPFGTSLPALDSMARNSKRKKKI